MTMDLMHQSDQGRASSAAPPAKTNPPTVPTDDTDAAAAPGVVAMVDSNIDVAPNIGVASIITLKDNSVTADETDRDSGVLHAQALVRCAPPEGLAPLGGSGAPLGTPTAGENTPLHKHEQSAHVPSGPPGLREGL